MAKETTASWPNVVKDWAKADPVAALLLAGIAALLVSFFGFAPLFSNYRLSTWLWAWQAWTPETNYEHAKLIPLIVAFVVWTSRHRLQAAKTDSSNWGWLFLIVGLFLAVGGARTLQAR